MHLKEIYQQKMRLQLDELKAEIAELREKAEQAEVNVELEYYTLIDELQVKLESANQKLHMLTQASEDNWEEFKSEFELIWGSLRDLIKSVTSP